MTCIHLRRGHGDTDMDVHSGWPHEDKGCRCISQSQGERPQGKPNQLACRSGTSSYKNGEEINLCRLSHLSVVLGYGSLSKWMHPVFLGLHDHEGPSQPVHQDFSSVQLSRSVVSDSLRLHEKGSLKTAAGVCPSPCPLLTATREKPEQQWRPSTAKNKK